MESGSSCWRLLLCWICALAAARANVSVRSKVSCLEQSMVVDMVRSSPRASIYLQHLKNFPDEACKPQLTNDIATFRLSLLEEDILRCGITKVVNKVTGQTVYFHRIIEEDPTDTSKHTYTVKCITNGDLKEPEISIASNHTTVRRSVFPAGFQEPDKFSGCQFRFLPKPIDAIYVPRRIIILAVLTYRRVEIKAEISVSAPMPILGVGVRQGGTLVTGELSVSPGTPLQMEIFLDKDSAPVYGLLVSYMLVTDTKFQEETIILNGCCIDRSVFDNFNTVDGDFLAAKFRAFKFADSNYVQFRGTVNVCLDKCQGIECGNGQVGFGRKRRAIEASNNDKNKLFEVTMSTFIKVDFEEDAVVDKALSDLYIRKGKNRTKARAVMAENVREQVAPTTIRTEERAFIAQQVNEQFEYQVTKMETSGSSCRTIAIGLAFVLLSLCNLL